MDDVVLGLLGLHALYTTQGCCATLVLMTLHYAKKTYKPLQTWLQMAPQVNVDAEGLYLSGECIAERILRLY